MHANCLCKSQTYSMAPEPVVAPHSQKCFNIDKTCILTTLNVSPTIANSNLNNICNAIG